mgnify:CR=1 FL=1
MCVLLKSNIFGLFFVAWQSLQIFLNKYVIHIQPIPPGPTVYHQNLHKLLYRTF